MKAFKLQEALELFDRSLQLEQPHLAIINHRDAEKFSNRWSMRKPVVKNIIASEQWLKESIPSALNPDDIRLLLRKLIADAAGMEISEINEEESFTNLGVDSISALDIVSLLETEYKMSLTPTLLYEYDSIKKLSDYFIHLKTHSKAAGFPLLPTQKVFYSNQVF